MSDLNRFSSRRERLDKVFLADRLRGARSYRRIAGYFRSSIFELVGEEISSIPDVRILCNSELDVVDIAVSKAVRDAALKEKWNQVPVETEALLYREQYRKLHAILTNGNVQIRVVPKNKVFLHGKAGVIELPDGRKTSFLGSINETKSAFTDNYEILWEDPSPEGVQWVEEEFEALWADSHALPDAIVEEVRRVADRVEVRFEDVSFSYQLAAEGANPDIAAHVRRQAAEHGERPASGVEWVLKNVDIRIEAGESVAIVGATGAGKTSIISLVSRFYDVQRGRILLDGVDIRELRQRDLRRHIGVVLQDPFIFAGTIASNIRLNDATITDERVRQAAHFVNADRFIDRLPEGYDTVVTERGSMLSVGQKQLLAFARAIAFNPEILLVLDEATSSVDTETEHLIQDALAKLMRGRTSIIIAPRLSTIQNVDRIIVLHKGRVVESGTHRELLAERGVYHRLYELQYRAHQAV